MRTHFYPSFCFLSVFVPRNGSSSRKNVSRVYWIYINTHLFPLYSANIRKALACAIDRKQITKKFQGKPCIPNAILTLAQQKVSCWNGNAAVAQEFFREGLKELNIGHNEFPVITLYWSADDERDLIRVIQEQIQSALRIKIQLKNIEWQSLSYLFDKREYQMASCYRSPLPLYPRSYLELFRDRTNLYNSSQWENANYKTYLDRALQCFHVEEREKWLTKAEQILMDEMPIIPIFFPDFDYLLNQKIKRAVIGPNGDVDFKWISMSQK